MGWRMGIKKCYCDDKGICHECAKSILLCNKSDLFLGKKMSYWYELNQYVKENLYDQIIEENAELRYIKEELERLLEAARESRDYWYEVAIGKREKPRTTRFIINDGHFDKEEL